MEKPDNYLLPAQVAETVVQYLASRPYSEVYEMVDALTHLQRLLTQEPTDGENDDV